ncbi:MAG TPA: carboxypeptidase regulatory-like domain-containing protein [Terriglobales bacterium]|nr:carboxypeptidase regulatory-like domain-containing protein [Terriglobales bacterium]
MKSHSLTLFPCRFTVFSCLFVCFLVLFSTTLVSGQAGRGTVSGTITDPSGAALPGVQVVLLSKDTGAKQQTVTNDAGLYNFVSLNPGVYQITASHSGFNSVVRDQVRVSVDQATLVNLSMQVGAATETVTVTAGTDLVEPSNSTVGALISAQTMDRVPLLTRNVYDLVQLSSGVTPANGAPNSDSSFAIENISSGRPGVNVSSYTFNGAIIGSVYYMIDGSPVGVAENNSGAIIPAWQIPEDAVSEMRMETQNTSASYQSGAAGVISLVTNSGTNKIHGDVFGVFRPNVLAANEYFNKQSQLAQGLPNTTPDFHRYQEGASIGGPIKKDKLFFYGDFEATQQQLYDGSNFFTVPTSAERVGDFSNMGFTIYDPTQPGVGGLRQAFPGNIITNPNPTGLQFLSMMPKCNYPSPAACEAATTDVVPNFFKPGLDPYHSYKFDVRMDWVKSQRQRIFGRFSYDRGELATFNAFDNMWDLNYAQNITNARNILLADDFTVNNSTVLQFRYSFTRHYENQGGDPAQNGYDITKLGFPASLAAEQNYKILPFVLFNDVGNGVGGTANYNTFQFASENSDASIAITKVWGKHEISAGFEYMRRYLNVGQPPAPAGAYAFDISATNQCNSNSAACQALVASGADLGGSDFASLLVGMGTAPGTESNGYPSFTKDIFAAEASPYYSGFVEDTIRATKSLTITAGLRWDIFGGRTERYNRLEYFNPNVSNTVSGVSYTGAEVYINGGSPFNTNLNNFAPRLGFAYQPFAHVVVRGGAGFYYGPSTQMVASATLNSDGYASQTFWDATCINADGNTALNGSSACVGAAPGSPAPSFTGPYALNNPFPNGVVPTFTSTPTGLGNNLGTTLNTVLQSQRTPTTYNFNFGIENELPAGFILSLAYVGSRGIFLPFASADLNTLDLATIGKYGASLCVDTSDPSCTMVPNQWANILPANNANSGAATVPLWVALQQYPQFGNGNYGDGNGILVHGYPAGDSFYNSLQTKLQKRYSNHLAVLSSFTWAKLMTNDGNPPLGFVGSHLGAPQDWKDLQYEWAVSPQDVRYQFTGQASYDLPMGHGRALNLEGAGNAILGGWTINGILYLSTGIPIASPTAGSWAGVSYFNQRPDLICNPAVGAPHTASAWFNPSCFAFPSSPFVAGSAPAYLDSVRTMGARNLDLQLYKTLALGETRQLRFDISCYNVGNRAQLGMPSVPDLYSVTTDPSVAASFGQITNTVNSPRQFQFGARFTF